MWNSDQQRVELPKINIFFTTNGISFIHTNALNYFLSLHLSSEFEYTRSTYIYKVDLSEHLGDVREDNFVLDSTFLPATSFSDVNLYVNKSS